MNILFLGKSGLQGINVSLRMSMMIPRGTERGLALMDESILRGTRRLHVEVRVLVNLRPREVYEAGNYGRGYIYEYVLRVIIVQRRHLS
jgi:hypothetical protein